MAIVRRRSGPSSPRGMDLDVVQKTASFTMDANYIDAVVQATSGSGITVTLPNSMPVGWHCLVEMGGAGVVTFAAASGATLRHRQSHTTIAGQYGTASLYVRANHNGVSAEWLIAGDTAA